MDLRPDALPDDSPTVLTTLGDGAVVAIDGEAGTAAIEFTCRPEMCHTGGVAQGGFVTGWIDAAIAHACIARYSAEHWAASLEIKVSFLRPTRPGRVRAEGWVVRAGGQTVFGEGHLLDEDGTVLAKASSTVLMVPNRAG